MQDQYADREVPPVPDPAGGTLYEQTSKKGNRSCHNIPKRVKQMVSETRDGDSRVNQTKIMLKVFSDVMLRGRLHDVRCMKYLFLSAYPLYP